MTRLLPTAARHLSRRWFTGLLCAALLVGLPENFRAAKADEPKGAFARSVLRLEPEIDCPSCEDGIKHALLTARGVQSAEIDVLTNRIVVRYDPARVRLPALVGRIRVYGYTATEVK